MQSVCRILNCLFGPQTIVRHWNCLLSLQIRPHVLMQQVNFTFLNTSVCYFYGGNLQVALPVSENHYLGMKSRCFRQNIRGYEDDGTSKAKEMLE